jgi:hypothetical protein
MNGELLNSDVNRVIQKFKYQRGSVVENMTEPLIFISKWLLYRKHQLQFSVEQN